jgi:hypothetical protein
MTPKNSVAPPTFPFFYQRLRNPNFEPNSFDTAPVLGLVKDLDKSVGSILRNGMRFYAHAAPNISPGHLRELGSFLIKEELMVVECDKNMGFAVVDTSMVRSAIERKLFSPAFEKFDPEAGRKALVGAVKRFSDLLDKDFLSNPNFPKEFYDILKSVKPNEFRIQPNKINPLAKLHKDKFDAATWRLIIQAHLSPFQLFDAWFAQFMEAVLKLIPQRIPDSITLIKRLESLRFGADEPIAFGKVDITDLYNSLDLDLVREALSHYLHIHFERLGNDRRKTGPWSIKTILALLDIANQNNFVEYGGFWYRQRIGIAMGRAAGVIIADLTLAYTEISIYDLEEFSSPDFLLKARYIDDTPFVIRYAHPFGRVIAYRYKQALGIDTTVEADVVSENGEDHKSFPALDFTVTRVGDHLEISPFEKPTNLHLFIPPRSNHPPHTAKGWILGYLKRLAVNSSNVRIFNEAALAFFSQLRARGFRRAFLLEIFAKMDYAPSRRQSFAKHDSLVRSYEQSIAPRSRDPTTAFFFPLPYNRNLGSMNWSRLLNSIRDLEAENLQYVSLNYPRFRTAWSSLPNLRALVVRTLQSRLQGQTNPNPNPSQVAHSIVKH